MRGSYSEMSTVDKPNGTRKTSNSKHTFLNIVSFRTNGRKSYEVIACVTRQTTRLAVDSSNPRKVSPITCRNEPEARTRTCIMAEKAWFLFVCGVISKLIVGQRSDLERSDHGTNLEQRPFNFFTIRWIQIYTTYLTMDNFICWIASG